MAVLNKVRWFFFGLMLASFMPSANAQDLSLFKKQWLIQSGDTLPYRILLPDNFDSTKQYPLLIFLHGRGESGSDNEKQLTIGASFFLRDSVRKKFPAIIVFPQCSATDYWSNVAMITEGSSMAKRNFYFLPDGDPSVSMRLLMNLVTNLQLRYPVQARQVYVGGLSMGGMGTYELVRRMPRVFAAAFAICGGAHPSTAQQIRQTPFWIFHGLKDDVVPAENSMVIANALKAAGGQVKLTLYEGIGHNSWDLALAEPGLLKWLFGNKR